MTKIQQDVRFPGNLRWIFLNRFTKGLVQVSPRQLIRGKIQCHKIQTIHRRLPFPKLRQHLAPVSNPAAPADAERAF